MPDGWADELPLTTLVDQDPLLVPPALQSAEQVWRGPYGALIVEEPEAPALLTLLLHDICHILDHGDLGMLHLQ